MTELYVWSSPQGPYVYVNWIEVEPAVISFIKTEGYYQGKGVKVFPTPENKKALEAAGYTFYYPMR